MTRGVARHGGIAVALTRMALRLVLGGFALVGGCHSLQTAVADGDTRTITMHHLHTGEDITITYKRDGVYDEAALKKLDWFLRDWREKKAIHMDPHLIDLVWEVNRELGGTQPIQVVCGYRDESTNEMLRHRSRASGVARFSQHTLGKAMDFYIPGVSLEKIRIAGLRLQRGGVGFYPTSGSPFVHLDVGGVRYWPRMSRQQLARVFPDGRTVYLPSDGKPMRNYALALADIRKRGASSPSELSLASAENAGMIDGSSPPAANPVKSLFASLFGSHDSRSAPAGWPEPPSATASGGETKTSEPVEVASAHVPLPKTRPGPDSMTVIASLPPQALAGEQGAALATRVASAAGPTPSEIVRARGYWVGATDITPPPANGHLLLASTEPENTASIPPEFAQKPPQVPGVMLAYAAEPSELRSPQTVVTRWAAVATSVATKAKVAPRRPAMPIFDPWLDAVSTTPSVRMYLSTSKYGPSELATLTALLDKPAMSVAMNFSQDMPPNPPDDRFSGRAVVFLETVTFGADPLKTASLH